jgi:cytidylate kinase
VSQLKQALGLVGLLVAIAGVALESRLVVWVAIGILAVSVLIRAVVSIRSRRGREDAPGADEGGQ